MSEHARSASSQFTAAAAAALLSVGLVVSDGARAQSSSESRQRKAAPRIGAAGRSPPPTMAIVTSVNDVIGLNICIGSK